MEQLTKYIPWALGIWGLGVLLSFTADVILGRDKDALIEAQRKLIAVQERRIELLSIQHSLTPVKRND